MSADPGRIQGAVTLYRARQASFYRIQPMCIRGSLGFAEAGEATTVPVDDDEMLLKLLDHALASYKTNKYEADGPPRYSASEYREFVRNHDAIMVVRHEDGGLELTPWVRFRGGYKAVSAASVSLQQPVAAHLVAAAVREAFQRGASS